MTGAVTGTLTPPVEPVGLPEPELLEPPVPVGPAQVAEALPSRPTPLPQTVTGAVTGTSITAPEPVVEPEPALELPEPPVLLGLPEPATAQLAEARPTALPQIVTGAVTGALTSDRCRAGVVAGALPVPAAEPVLAVLACRPLSTATALPLTVTGAVTGTEIAACRAVAVVAG